MNLKPTLLTTMSNLGVTSAELELLRGRMMGSVSSLQAQIVALESQIAVLESQRQAALTELAQAQITVGKLVE